MCPEALPEAFDLALFVAWSAWFVSGMVAWHLRQRSDAEQLRRVTALARRVERLLAHVLVCTQATQRAIDGGELSDEIDVLLEEPPLSQ
jgi:hypothetical protein